MPKRKSDSAALANRVLEELMNGRTITEICANEPWAPTHTVFYRWLAEDRWELQSRYEITRRICTDVIAEMRLDKLRELEDGHTLIEDSLGVERVNTGLVRLAYDVEKEFRTRFNPEAWAGKQIVNTADKDGNLKELNVIAVPVKDLAGPGATPPREEKPKEEDDE